MRYIIFIFTVILVLTIKWSELVVTMNYHKLSINGNYFYCGKFSLYLQKNAGCDEQTPYMDGKLL